MDDLVSNEVLELEKQVVDLQIAQLKIEGENPPPELEFRAQGIAMKLDLLVMMVQTGQLTVEGMFLVCEDAVFKRIVSDVFLGTVGGF